MCLRDCDSPRRLSGFVTGAEKQSGLSLESSDYSPVAPTCSICTLANGRSFSKYAVCCSILRLVGEASLYLVY